MKKSFVLGASLKDAGCLTLSWVQNNWKRMLGFMAIGLCLLFVIFSVAFVLYKVLVWLSPVLVILLFLPMFAWVLFTMVSLIGLLGTGLVALLFLIPALCGNKDAVFRIFVAIVFSILILGNLWVCMIVTKGYTHWADTTF